MKSTDFIEEYLVKNVESMLKEKQYYPLLVYATIGIETLGAMIDNKPIRVRNQSKYRFGTALYQLFPNQYGFINKEAFLYEALRNHSAHNLMPSGKMMILNENNGTIRHLEPRKEKVSFIIEDFAKDFLEACKLALKMIEEGKARVKFIEV